MKHEVCSMKNEIFNDNESREAQRRANDNK